MIKLIAKIRVNFLITKCFNYFYYASLYTQEKIIRKVSMKGTFLMLGMTFYLR